MGPGAHPYEYTPHPNATSAQLSHADTHTGQVPVTQPTPVAGTHTCPRADLLCTQTCHADKTRPPTQQDSHHEQHQHLPMCTHAEGSVHNHTPPPHSSWGSPPDPESSLLSRKFPSPPGRPRGLYPGVLRARDGRQPPRKAVTLSPPHVEVPAVQ